ncbi:hypothetical protein [Sinorhizobium psoraleae]|uniref:Holin n=1 Tax=Sinorhizobium psoraleae TaxID=520838 RepID=A0ABT4KDL6_9HYPH|nr:hypothetical protein [Sinorhizobium psoraleae]MCZ4089082.1 hypothetical protein [Sinorhizobium psoraleae]
MFSTIAGWLAAMGIQPVHFFAGLAGGIVRALVDKKGSPWERIVAGAVGTLCASILTPFVLLILGVTSPHMVGAIAFVVGLVGLSMTEAVIKIGKDYARNPGKLKEDFGSLLLRVFTKDDKDGK